jgi:outer membrane biosynthesis protein TonB
MQIGFTYSILLHIGLLLVFMFGVDHSKRLEQQEETILLELIPISTITNVKTTVNDVKPIDIKKQIVSKNDAKKDIKTVLKDSDEDNQNISQKKELPQEKIIEKKEVEKPISIQPKEENKPQLEQPSDNKETVPTKDIKKEPEKKQIKEQKQAVEAKPTKKADDKKKDIEKPKKDKKQDPDEELANSVLKSLKEGGKKSSKNNKKQQSLDDIMENAIKGDTTSDFDSESELSMSEIAAIRSQISQAWRVTSFSGGKDNKNLRVTMKIQVDENGEVKDIKVKSKTIPNGADGSVYNAFVDSVVRAIKAASPLQHLPKEKYNSWSEMELIFDSSGMIY